MDEQSRLSRQEENKRYNTHQNNPKDPDYISFLKRLTDHMLPFLHSQDQGLDFGCGPGPAIQGILASNGIKVENYDPFYYADNELLLKKYDFMTCTEVVEHCFNPRQTFECFNSCLKSPGGMLGVMTNVFSDQIVFKDWWYVKDPTHVSFYSRKTFQWIADWLKWKVDFPAENIAIFKT